MPPLLVNNKLVTDFLDKANLFHDFFMEQRRPITNDSCFPSNHVIIKLFCSLDLNKAYGCDGVPIRMLKLCEMSILKISIYSF